MYSYIKGGTELKGQYAVLRLFEYMHF